VKFRADTIVYFTEEKRVLLLGNGVIEYEDLRVFSDSMIFDTEKKILTAYKDVVFKSKTDSLHGKKLEYSLNTRKAVMWHGRTAIEKGYFRGEGIWLVKEKVLHVTHGYYTTCEKNPPHYYFYSPRLKVFLDDMVLAKPIVLTVYKFPVAVAPFWFFPIGRKRKSGLLPFKFGNSLNEGQYAKGVAYYWVINDYADMTFSADIMEKKGIKTGFEGIWIVRPYTSGRVGGSYIKEIDTKRERWNVAANADALLFYDISATSHVDLSSDASYINDYTEEPELWVKKEAESNLNLSKTTRIGSFSLVFSRKDNFQDSITVMNLPILSFSPRFIRFGDLSLSEGFSFHRTEEIEKGSIVKEVAFNENYSLSYGKKIFGAYNLSNVVRFGEKRVFLPERDIEGSYNFTSSLNFHLYRIFWIGGRIEGILHDMVPSFGVSVSPHVNKGRVVIPRIDTFPSSLGLVFSLNNNFQAKIVEDEKSRKVNFLQLNLSTSFDLKEKRLSPFSIFMNIPNFLLGSFLLTGTFHPDSLAFTYSINVFQKFTAKDTAKDSLRSPLYFLRSFSINIDYGKGKNAMGTLSFTLEPGFGLSLDYSAFINLSQRDFLSSSIGIRKDLHCWEALFSWSMLGTDRRYDIKLRIKEIPEVEIGKGLLGFLLPQ